MAKTKFTQDNSMTDSETKIYVFKVALKRRKGVWRKIAIRGDQKLSDLHDEIFRAFDRYDPHLYCFYFTSKPTFTSRTRLQGARSYGCPQTTDTKYRAGQTSIEQLPLRINKQFEYLFDYGAEWWHLLTLEDIQDPQPGVIYPCVVASRSPSPRQYDIPEDEEYED